MDISKEEIVSLLGNQSPIILDIGSYNGKDAAELSELFDSPEIHCFEALPKNQEAWKDLNSSNHDMTLYHTAIGRADHPIIFNVSSKDQSGSLRRAKTHLELFPEVTFKEKVKVMCFKLDTWSSYVLPDKEIDFIWCDVNGSEQDVIFGGSETLKRTKYLYIEFSDKELYEGQMIKEDLLSLLPGWTELGVYNFEGNFGNILLKNKNL